MNQVVDLFLSDTRKKIINNNVYHPAACESDVRRHSDNNSIMLRYHFSHAHHPEVPYHPPSEFQLFQVELDDDDPCGTHDEAALTASFFIQTITGIDI